MNNNTQRNVLLAETKLRRQCFYFFCIVIVCCLQFKSGVIRGKGAEHLEGREIRHLGKREEVLWEWPSLVARLDM